MKVLFLSQGRVIEDHPGHHDALGRLQKNGIIEKFVNLPYFGFVQQHGYARLWEKIVTEARDLACDLVYFQYFHSREHPNPQECVAALRQLPSQPTVIVSCGDSFTFNWMWPRFPDSFVKCAHVCDLTFISQMGRTAELLLSKGVKNIVLLPHGVCEVRFDFECPVASREKQFDVVWVGNNRTLKPDLCSRAFWNSRKRVQVVNVLTRKFGPRFGLFGARWEKNPCCQGAIPFKQQQEVFRRSHLVVDSIPDPFGDLYYASDRPFYALASGVPLIMFEKEGLDRIFKRDEHVYFVKNEKELLSTCERLLASDPFEMHEKAIRASQWVKERHTQYERMAFVLDTVQCYRKAKLQNQRAPVPTIPFFLPEVDLTEEIEKAVRGWVG